jgi:hypothetical protein
MTERDDISFIPESERSKAHILDVASQYKHESRTADNQKKGEGALEIVDQYLEGLFADQYGKPFAVIRVNQHLETIPVGSANFKHWLSKVYYEEKKEALSSEAISAVLNTLKGRALYDGPRRHIEVRTASMPGENAIYLDLTNPEWQAVRIAPEGWTIGQAPLLFTRYNHQLPQVKPAKNAPKDTFDKFLALTNIANPEHRLLVKVYIVALFVPDISKPVLVADGEQGSAKTFLQRMIKSVVDPSAADALAMPKQPAELIQQLSHNYVALYDNLSKLDDWASDIFCKAVTGGGSSKRMLYSDDDDIVYNFKRCVMFNGINVVARKPDLLDRALMIHLERIPKEKRRKESDLLAELEAIKPDLLGHIMDILVEVQRRKGEVHLTEYPRLADFAEYGELIARCMGEEEGKFTAAYFENQKLQTIEALEAQPIGTAVIKLIEKEGAWKPASLGALLEKLEEIAAANKISTKSKGWPKAANSLSRRLNEVRTNLREVGIDVKLDTDSGTNTRTVEIRKISPVSPEPPEGQNQAQMKPPTSGDMSGDTASETSGDTSGES